MATGGVWQPGGVIAPNDLPSSGDSAWARHTGIHPMSPLVGGPGEPGDPMSLPFSVSHGSGRIVSQDSWASTGPMDGPGVQFLDDWRGAFDPRNPLFWLMLLTLGIVGLVHLQVRFRVGRGG